MIGYPKLDERDPQPLYMQLYVHIKTGIIRGEIAEDTRLPSIRKLAGFLGLSTTPVESAYHQLLSEGYIASRPKSGYYVEKLPEPYGKLGSLHMGELPPVQEEEPDAARKRRFRYDFHLSRNDFTAFPYGTWKKLANEVLVPDNENLLFFGDPRGERRLREQIAAYLRQMRGVECSPGQVVVGADQFNLGVILSQILKRFGSRLAVENPGYPLIPSIFGRAGYEILPVPLEADGIDVERLHAAGARLVTVTPSHQFPRGMVMPVSKRLKLLQWARDTDGFILEDDYDGEFRYHGRPVPALQALVPGAPVIYLGGFGQIMAPALCVSYMVLPDKLVPLFDALRREMMFEQSASRLHQHTLALFMERGYLEKHVRRMRKLYRKKHDRLTAAVGRFFGSRAAVIGRDAGFHIVLRVRDDRPEAELLRQAEADGVHVSSAAFYWPGTVPPEGEKDFMVGFSGIAEEDIEPGIRKLKEAWFGDANLSS
ncbi:PLP-dependent aminotransferase family protein [Paenibacillus chitinolyticus]|uniref:MocR-like pyridoxine biosynthesis transcription factor PdxR n=1 Tax=Paenibacillus chitinolyticus TaxID=79263 RepID=UPI0036DF5C96